MEFRLPRLPRGIKIAGKGGEPTTDFARWWQSTIEKIEAQEALQDETIAQVQANQLDIIAAQDELASQLEQIIAAQSAADAAQASADAVTLQNAISSSFIVPSSVLGATDAGSDATINVAAFTRHYDDGAPSVSVSAGSITGLAYETVYSVYYDDADRDDTAPTFVATTSGVEARHNYALGRHFVGIITTPASGGADTDGGGYSAPGGGGFNDDGTSLP